MKSPLAYCLVLAVTGGLSFNVLAAEADKAAPAPVPKVSVPAAQPDETAKASTPKTDEASTGTPKTDSAKTGTPKDAEPPAQAKPEPAQAQSEPAADRKLTQKENEEINGVPGSKHKGWLKLFEGYRSTFKGQHDSEAVKIFKEFDSKYKDVNNRKTFQYLKDLKDYDNRLKARLDVLAVKDPGQKPAAPHRGRVANTRQPLPSRYPAPRRLPTEPVGADDDGYDVGDEVLPPPGGNRGSQAGAQVHCRACDAPIPAVPPYEPLREVARRVVPVGGVDAAAVPPVTPAIPATPPLTPAIPTRAPFGSPSDLLALNALLGSSLFPQSQFGINPAFGLGNRGPFSPYGLTPAIPNGPYGQPWNQAGFGYGNGLTPAIPSLSGGLTPAIPLFAGGLGGGFNGGGFPGAFGGGFNGGFNGGFGYNPAMPIGGGFNNFGGGISIPPSNGLPFGSAFAGNSFGGGAPALAPYLGAAGGTSAFNTGGFNGAAVGGAPALRPYVNGSSAPNLLPPR